MKTNMRLLFNMIALVTVLLVSCSSETDAEILMGTETCKAPCWMDIQPGVTESADAVQILEEHKIDGEGQLTLLESGIARWQSASGKNVYVYMDSNELVSKIELDLRPSSIHLDGIIALFGEPTNLDIGKIRDGYFFVTIAYPEAGLAFVGSGNEIDVSNTKMGFVIKPDMIVVNAVFFPPSDIAKMVNLLYGEEAVSEALSDIQVWKGYDVYRE